MIDNHNPLRQEPPQADLNKQVRSTRSMGEQAADRPVAWQRLECPNGRAWLSYLREDGSRQPLSSSAGCHGRREPADRLSSSGAARCARCAITLRPLLFGLSPVRRDSVVNRAETLLGQELLHRGERAGGRLFLRDMAKLGEGNEAAVADSFHIVAGVAERDHRVPLSPDQ
jgi:hypothetical protein